ncbi:MAG: hypothetical protein M3Y08_02345 [Fibrobacterota bacterium]|nr:hypothetical protein [Fibrobacterota bacterium]
MQTQVVEAAPMRQVKGFTGNRYSSAQKKRVTEFVQEYDSIHGRGGIAAAQRQFKVSYIALRNWLTGKDDPKGKRAQGFLPVLDRLLSIKGQMRDLEKELRRLRRRV